jgi:DNA-binding CsgD family transcriptional regulator
MLQTGSCTGGIVDKVDIIADLAAEWRLSPMHLSVYKWALTREFVSADETADVLGLAHAEAEQILDDLVNAHLMETRHDDESSGALGTWRRVLNPQIAAARLAATESRLRQLMLDLNTSRQRFDDLFNVYSVLGTARPTQNSVEVFGSLSDVVSLVDEASRGCKTEMISSQPGGGRPVEQLEQAVARDLQLLERGVRMRTLYQHSARHHPPTRAYVDKVTSAGAEVRTCPELFGRLIVFDRAVAFIPHHSLPGGAAVVRDPSTIAFLHSAFERAWDLGTPFAENRPDLTALSDVHRNILHLLGEGARDETIARRLGFSLRTCRKYIAEIFDMLGAESRFQAGYLTADRDLLK